MMGNTSVPVPWRRGAHEADPTTVTINVMYASMGALGEMRFANESVPSVSAAYPIRNMAFQVGIALPNIGINRWNPTATSGAAIGVVGGAAGKPTPEKPLTLVHKRHNDSGAPPHAAPSASSNHMGRMGATVRTANEPPKARGINVARSFNMRSEDSGIEVHHPEYLVQW